MIGAIIYTILGICIWYFWYDLGNPRLVVYIVAPLAVLHLVTNFLGFFNRKRQRLSQMRSLHDSITKIVKDARNTVTLLPETIRRAEDFLDIAEHEFNEGAFAPFWDAIEKSTVQLATFRNHIQSIDTSTTNYTNAVASFDKQFSKQDITPPPLDLGVSLLPDATGIINRLSNIVRLAQKDYQFASIYEQRKTNQLLVSGFSTLGQAINELGHRLKSALDDLSSSLSDALAEAGASQAQATSELLEGLKSAQQHFENESYSRRQHEKRAQAMLDNIQRDRKPIF